jgi:hypothetical protein
MISPHRAFLSLTFMGPTLLTIAPLGAQEVIPPPRVAEVLTVMPRDTTGQPTRDDPPSVIRGAIRALGTYDNPYSAEPLKMTKQQTQLLRSLNQLRLFEPEDDLDHEWEHRQPKALGPEPILVKPRVVGK